MQFLGCRYAVVKGVMNVFRCCYVVSKRCLLVNIHTIAKVFYVVAKALLCGCRGVTSYF